MTLISNIRHTRALLRHSRQLLSGIHLQSDSDESPPTNCGDDGPVIVICIFPSFPTVVIGNPSSSYFRSPLRHSRESGNPEHRPSIATAPSSLTPQTKASHPTSKHQNYQGNKKLAPLARALGWTHNLLIPGKCKTRNTQSDE